MWPVSIALLLYLPTKAKSSCVPTVYSPWLYVSVLLPCSLLWDVRVLHEEKALPHCVHTKFSSQSPCGTASAWCLIRCTFSVLFWAVAYLQYVHLNGFSPAMLTYTIQSHRLYSRVAITLFINHIIFNVHQVSQNKGT